MQHEMSSRWEYLKVNIQGAGKITQGKKERKEQSLLSIELFAC